MRIIQITDTHIRPLSRHAEFKSVFLELQEKALELKPDHILHTGDIFHTKRNISPEYINLVTWWFNSLAQIAPLHIVRGNHDGLIHNLTMVDAVSPIVNAMNNSRIKLYDKSGVYKLAPGYNLCIYCIFDKEGWKNVAPVDGDTNIAVYHGPVNGATTEENWELTGDFNVADFEKYDACTLGDIHKTQFLGHREYEFEIDESELEYYPDAVIIE